jgi:hypothetical protein
MIEAMGRLENALAPHLAKLKANWPRKANEASERTTAVPNHCHREQRPMKRATMKQETLMLALLASVLAGQRHAYRYRGCDPRWVLRAEVQCAAVR